MTPPKVENAPGLIWRARKRGWSAYWQARTDLVARGWEPAMVMLWRGDEPSEIERASMSDSCQRMQAEMLVWGRGAPMVGTYDGTIRSLSQCYQTDADSTFRKNRYQTRRHYEVLLRRVERDHGDERVADLRGREMMRWHEAWAVSGIPMAHSLMGMVRSLFGFGMTLLECEECTRMCAILSKQRFAMGKSSDVQLTADMAIAIRAEAHKRGLHSIALAQAIQFECAFRQKDAIGEWVPEGEPGLSDVTHGGDKWLRGIRWSEIDGNLVLHHVTSKRQKMHEPDLRHAPMVLEEFALLGELPKSGPVIVCERTGRPWRSHYFRQLWREIARAAGVPDEVKSMHSRHGAISEATDSGASLEDTRHMATHSDISMTAKYSRGSEQKTATVMKMRAAHRLKPTT